MMESKGILILAYLLIQATYTVATRPDPHHKPGLAPTPNPLHEKDRPCMAAHGDKKVGSGNGDGGGGGFERFFGPGSEFGIPDFGNGYEGPSGGYVRGGVVRPTVVCKQKGPCYGKKLRCPAKCFKTYSHAGKGYGYGGGGGRCTMDCNKKCVAYCASY